MQGNTFKSLVVVSALLVLPVNGSTQPHPPAPDGTADALAPAAEAVRLTIKERSFFIDAAESGHAELEAARLAAEKTRSDDVQEYASSMIADHTRINEELKALADMKGVSLPDGPSLLQKAEIKALSILDARFDENYIDRLGVVAHEKAIKLFQETAEHCDDADIKAFVKRTLPVLKHHLQMAKGLHPTMSKTR